MSKPNREVYLFALGVQLGTLLKASSAVAPLLDVVAPQLAPAAGDLHSAVAAFVERVREALR